MPKIKSYRQSGKRYAVANESLEVASVEALTTAQLDQLQCGDIVIKKDAAGKHAYLVAYRAENEIALVYTDYHTVEEIYYEKSAGVWGSAIKEVETLNA